MKITIAQLNPHIGDFEGVIQKIERAFIQASTDMSAIIVFPELFLTGYPPRDLLLRPSFIEEVMKTKDIITTMSLQFPNIGILIGMPLINSVATEKPLYNSVVLIENGQALFVQHKHLLPTYDVFDETRYFEPGKSHVVFPYKNERLAITICEDAWATFHAETTYKISPVETLAQQNPTLMINVMASPYEHGKHTLREHVFCEISKALQIPVVAVNQIGAQDELIFDGGSFVANQGELVWQASFMTEAITTISTSDIVSSPDAFSPNLNQDDLSLTYQALVLGVRDYFSKCGFSNAVLGLSGGIDSALCAAIVSQAIGPTNVTGIAMPSEYSSQGSLDDAKALADNLGIAYDVIPIQPSVNRLRETVSAFAGPLSDITSQNLQARTRGTILMAVSNQTNALLITTGNKSELAVGYCTLYGDMNGGLAVISDVPKLLAYELSAYINRDREIIPLNTLTKPPSAELKPDQKDEDSLPPYHVLDAIIAAYVEEKKSKAEIVSSGFDNSIVDWVVGAIDKSEYKRRQAAPGLKITSKAFGIGRRFPVAKYV